MHQLLNRTLLQRGAPATAAVIAAAVKRPAQPTLLEQRHVQVAAGLALAQLERQTQPALAAQLARVLGLGLLVQRGREGGADALLVQAGDDVAQEGVAARGCRGRGPVRPAAAAGEAEGV